MTDSTQIIDLLQTGGHIANAIRPQQWINGVDNNIVSAIVTGVASLIIGAIHRAKTIKKWKKNGKLN